MTGHTPIRYLPHKGDPLDVRVVKAIGRWTWNRRRGWNVLRYRMRSRYWS